MKKFLIFLIAAMLSLGTIAAQQPKSAQAIRKTVFVTDLHCQNCAKKIMNTIPYEKGVKDVSVDVPTKEVTVTYDSRKTDEKKLVKAFESIKIKAEPKQK